MAAANHPAFRTFSETGYICNYKIVEWIGTKCHVTMTSNDVYKVSMEAVWTLMPGHAHLPHFESEEGTCRVIDQLEDDTPTIVLSVKEKHMRQEHASVVWWPDVEPSSLYDSI